MKLTRFLTCISTGLFCSVTAFAAYPERAAISDQQFIQTAAQADMLETHLGQMAETQSSRRGVKDFGYGTAVDDTMNYQTLCSIANKLKLTVPKAIDSQGDKLISEVAKLKGNAFDQRFIRDEVKDGQNIVAVYEQEAQNGQNPALKSFASQQLPTVKLHYYEAQDLAKPQ